MSLQMARGMHRAFEELRSSLETEARDWRPLSLVANTKYYSSTQQMLGDERCAQAARHFERHSGHATNVQRILKQRSFQIFDPLSGQLINSTKSLALRKYHFLLFTGPSGPGFLTCVGSRPQILFYLNNKLWIDIRPHKENHLFVLKAFFSAASNLKRSFYRYISEPSTPKSACIVGDERPTHFIRESLGGIQYFIDKDQINDFWKAIDYLIVPIDNSFIVTDELFDVPDSVKIIYSSMGDLNRIITSKNLFTYRLMRSGSHMTCSLRNRLISYADSSSPAPYWPEVAKLINRKDYVTVWFSVEIEKHRIKNQHAVFSELLKSLNNKFGDKVQLIVDGWSPNPMSINSKDNRIISSIRSFTRDVMKDCGVHYDIIESYTMAYREKIRLAATIDFFVTMHGSAAIVPSLIRQKPGITYHSAWGMTIDHEVWTPSLYRTPTQDQTEEVVMGRWVPFDVDISSFRANLERVIADHVLVPSKESGESAIG